MYTLRLIQSLGPIDVRNVRRDSLLRWMLVLPLVIALAMRWVVPLMLERLSELFQVNLLVYASPILSYALLLLAPPLAGVVVGFLLLDQRDDRTLTALQVTPMPLSAYLTYRLALPMLVSLVSTLIAFPLAGFTQLGVLQLVLAALIAAPLAPVLALTLACFAENKVQGFALMKGLNVLLVLPIGAYVLGAPWGYAFGILPTYWPGAFYWALLEGAPHAWVFALGGVGYQALLVALLLRRFTRVMVRE